MLGGTCMLAVHKIPPRIPATKFESERIRKSKQLKAGQTLILLVVVNQIFGNYF